VNPIGICLRMAGACDRQMDGRRRMYISYAHDLSNGAIFNDLKWLSRNTPLFDVEYYRNLAWPT